MTYYIYISLNFLFMKMAHSYNLGITPVLHIGIIGSSPIGSIFFYFVP